ncbi:MarR family winged helix-turn-helix transcriptional regulator [Psychrobacter sp. Ps6]|uniref:MarR family winged helix-turn-helix transcriptional regulator n=1 Tax=Psychrobacter sp. Ps6 TaxID=2790960 RepID=UPI001EDF72DB|nr:MarR family winged helix-turn-helix transcriptional regulator [Psychrobacter sp. Ps6]MCG3880689.1 winged helix-turn-helix transcriptional regulator [Psychrobacter sp. Ps6]
MQICAKNEQINANLMEAARAVPHQVGLIKLSKTQLKVLQSINPGEEVTSEQIAERCNLSSSWASTLLKTIWERGYLVRDILVRQNGGVIYLYKKRVDIAYTSNYYT